MNPSITSLNKVPLGASQHSDGPDALPFQMSLLYPPPAQPNSPPQSIPLAVSLYMRKLDTSTLHAFANGVAAHLQTTTVPLVEPRQVPDAAESVVHDGDMHALAVITGLKIAAAAEGEFQSVGGLVTVAGLT